MLSALHVASRFDSWKIFKDLLPLLDELRKRRDVIHGDAKKNVMNRIDKDKYLVINELVNQLDAKILEFNKAAINNGDETKASIKLILKLQAIIYKTINNPQKKAIILTPRNDNQKNFDMVVLTGSYPATYLFATAVLGLTGPAAVVVGVAAFSPIYTVACKVTGANSILSKDAKSTNNSAANGSDVNPLDKPIVPKSAKLLLDLFHNLLLISQEHYQSVIHDPDGPPAGYRCALTGKVMTDPCVCLLDGRTYDRQAISDWLTEHGSAPDDTQIPNGKVINDVLVSNAELKHLIEVHTRDQYQVVLWQPSLSS